MVITNNREYKYFIINILFIGAVPSVNGSLRCYHHWLTRPTLLAETSLSRQAPGCYHLTHLFPAGLDPPSGQAPPEIPPTYTTAILLSFRTEHCCYLLTQHYPAVVSLERLKLPTLPSIVASIAPFIGRKKIVLEQLIKSASVGVPSPTPQKCWYFIR